MRFLLFVSFLALPFLINAQSAFSVKVSLENANQSELYMAQYFGDRPFIMDTSKRNAEGDFFFNGPDELEAGIYFIVIPPNNDFIQFMLNEKEQHVEIDADMKNLKDSQEFRKSKDNDLFLAYQKFIDEQRNKVKTLKGKIGAETSKGNPTDKLEDELESIDEETRAYKLGVYDENPHTVTGVMLRADLEPPFPDFDEPNPDTLLKRKFYFKKKHYFDYTNLADERLLRTPVLKQKVDYYMDKLTPQTADSLIVAMDRILVASESNMENFQYLFVQLLNKYSQSNMLGFDAITVHLVDEYVRKGRTDFLDEEVRNKLRSRAAKLKPLLLGKAAPDITVYDKEDQPVTLSEIDAEYTVLFFWKPSCPTCQKSMPDVIKFAKDHEAENVKVMAVCVEQGEKSADCWPYAKAKGMMDVFINTYDKSNKSRFYQKYDLTTTPRIMLLDKDKNILVNKMGAQQLEQLLEAMKKREG